VSNPQFDDIRGNMVEMAIAQQIGLTYEELQSLDWGLEAEHTHTIIHFHPDSDPTIMKKIRGLSEGRRAIIGPLERYLSPDGPDKQ